MPASAQASLTHDLIHEDASSWCTIRRSRVVPTTRPPICCNISSTQRMRTSFEYAPSLELLFLLGARSHGSYALSRVPRERYERRGHVGRCYHLHCIVLQGRFVRAMRWKYHEVRWLRCSDRCSSTHECYRLAVNSPIDAVCCGWSSSMNSSKSTTTPSPSTR